nr:venom protein [Lampona murina]
MKVILMFSLVAVVFCSKLEEEERGLVDTQEEEERGFHYAGCTEPGGGCVKLCDCCYSQEYCSWRFQCEYKDTPGFCQEKKEWCANYIDYDYQCFK